MTFTLVSNLFFINMYFKLHIFAERKSHHHHPHVNRGHLSPVASQQTPSCTTGILQQEMPQGALSWKEVRLAAPQGGAAHALWRVWRHPVGWLADTCERPAVRVMPFCVINTFPVCMCAEVTSSHSTLQLHGLQLLRLLCPWDWYVNATVGCLYPPPWDLPQPRDWNLPLHILLCCNAGSLFLNFAESHNLQNIQAKGPMFDWGT